MACKCFNKINRSLAAKQETSNTELERLFEVDFVKGRMSPPRAVIGTTKRNTMKRQRAATLVAVHCPFCGKKY